jgi:hypothetical protein
MWMLAGRKWRNLQAILNKIRCGLPGFSRHCNVIQS